jgi:hypothetical protein
MIPLKKYIKLFVSLGKIAIQRNNKSNNSGNQAKKPIAPVVKTSTEDTKPAKVAIKKNSTTTTSNITKKEPKSNKTSAKSAKAKKATEDTTAPQEGQQYILNGISITTAATSLTNESLAAMCDFEKAFGASTQQEQFDQQIQLQLQSILNGSAAAQLAKPKSPVQTRPAEPSPIKQVESMPSLDDFFSIGGAAPLEQSSPSPVKPTQKPLKPKPPKSKHVLNSPSPVKPSKNSQPTPTKAGPKNVQIRPKPTPSSPILPRPKDKIKFELSDLDNVLQHVESIATLANKASDEAQKSSDNFLYDLIGIEDQATATEPVIFIYFSKLMF